ncbi:trypsin-like serine protease [Luteimonas sp. Y-2-2-4F]|nr:trypsin-like serine protease [Luteimonas sp. Y-2-2-4F]MCD9031280.1 trypsin-like serine protease [Luteimonas sp. Y-2-2-4F]
MIRFLLPALLLAMPSIAGAVVTRHDVDDAQYRVPPSEFPALADMPGQGHGVLIAAQWVVTAAHTIPWHAELDRVVIAGIPREVDRVVLHPGYERPPQDLIDHAVATGEAILLLVQLASSDDIALVRLKEPVTDVAPAGLYEQDVVPGQVVELLGKGATGTGATGHSNDGPNRTELRRAFNTITSARDRWFCYVFDEPPSALPLEGALGNGDSGGPLLVEADGQRRLAGLAAWKVVPGHVVKSRPGRYGQPTCNVRLSHYSAWIESVLAGTPDDA